MAKEDVTQMDVLRQIAETLATVQQRANSSMDSAAALEKMTETLKELATRTRPENPEHNGLSAYSRPGGDYKDPKQPLKCDMYWVGFPLTIETLTPNEVDALNGLQPGNYFVTKGNGNRIPFDVDGKKDQQGRLREIWVQFPCKGDQMTDHRSLIDYCKEAMGEKLPTLHELQAEIARLKHDLGVAQEVIEAV